jgi:PHS family inorganic phosphate transporter-like MFS transporter
MWPEPSPEQELRVARTLGGNAAFHNWHNDFSHIIDPNQRRRLALSEIDKVPFGWYHARAIAVAGIGFFTDSYDIFAINFAVQMLGMAFWMEDGGIMPSNVASALKAATSGGAVIGQVGFGILADILGRRKMYGVELITIIASTLAQSVSSPSQAMTMTGLMAFWRVIMGIGVGGDYPMSAVITSEYVSSPMLLSKLHQGNLYRGVLANNRRFASTRWRGAMMASVFSMQGAGQFAAAMVALVVTAGFKSSFINVKDTAACDEVCQLAADRSWRIIIGAGALPAIFALYYRITIPETPRYTFDVAQDIEKADADIQAFRNGQHEGHPNALIRQRTILVASPSLDQPRGSVKDFMAYFGTWKNGTLLFSTMASWFFLDLAFYGLGLNSGVVLTAVGYGQSTESVYHTLFNSAVGNLIIITAGSLPGYWLSIIFIDSLGRRPIQIGGFAILTLLFCVIGFGYSALNTGPLLALYILAQLFFNFGPNTTTFIIPGECFPTRYRSTGHGLSAASGKFGAIVAQIIAQFLLTKDAPADCKGNDCSPWLPHLMEIFACFMFCGTLVSFLIPETKLQTLEVLAGEKPLRDPNSGASRNSGSTPDNKSPRSFLSPILRPMASPKLPSRSRDGKGGGSDKRKSGHGRPGSIDLDADMNRFGDRSWHTHDASVSVTSEGALLYGHSRGHKRSESYTSRNQRVDSIPLQDVGGLIFRDAIR